MNRNWLFALVALLFLSTFWTLGTHGLIDPDEGRYAEIAREMLESGDFVTPRLNYVKYFEKPALHYWLTAASFATFGQTEFAARLFPALCGLAGIAVTFELARRRWGTITAAYAGSILATSLLWFAIARLNILDMTLAFFVTLSVAGFWAGVRSDACSDAPSAGRGFLLFYVGMALATLSKGLIGIVLPGGIAFWYILLTRRWRLFVRALYFPGIVLFFLLTVPWFWAVCRVNDDFFYFFFIQEHFLRYATKMHDRYEPFWYFIPILIGGVVPWVGLLPDSLRVLFSASDKADAEKDFTLFLAIWFAVPFLFFSLSSSKLVPYILPCLPPIALVSGKLLDRISSGDVALARRFVVINAATLALLAAASVVYPLSDKKLGASLLLPYTLPAGAALLVMAAAGVLLYRKRSFRTMVRLLCVLAFVNVLAFSRGFALKAELDSYREPAAMIRPLLTAEDTVVGYRDPVQGLGFYLERRVVLANILGELEFGALQESDPRWFIGDEALKELWNGPRRVFLVADKRREKHLRDLLGDTTLLGRTRNDLVFVNRE